MRLVFGENQELGEDTQKSRRNEDIEVPAFGSPDGIPLHHRGKERLATLEPGAVLLFQSREREVKVICNRFKIKTQEGEHGNGI